MLGALAFETAGGGVDCDQLPGTHVFDPKHAAAQRPLVGRHHMLGTDAEDGVLVREPLAKARHRDLGAVDADAVGTGGDRAAGSKKIHRRAADEAGDEHGGGSLVDLARRSCLQHLALVHHRDHVGHRHGLDLVVRDVHRGRADAVVQRPQLLAHQLAERGIEGAERLVHEKRLRAADDGAAQCHALTIAAGEPRDGLVQRCPRCAKASPPRRPGR